GQELDLLARLHQAAGARGIPVALFARLAVEADGAVGMARWCGCTGLHRETGRQQQCGAHRRPTAVWHVVQGGYSCTKRMSKLLAPSVHLPASTRSYLPRFEMLPSNFVARPSAPLKDTVNFQPSGLSLPPVNSMLFGPGFMVPFTCFPSYCMTSTMVRCDPSL